MQASTYVNGNAFQTKVPNDNSTKYIFVYYTSYLVLRDEFIDRDTHRWLTLCNGLVRYWITLFYCAVSALAMVGLVLNYSVAFVVCMYLCLCRTGLLVLSETIGSPLY